MGKYHAEGQVVPGLTMNQARHIASMDQIRTNSYLFVDHNVMRNGNNQIGNNPYSDLGGGLHNQMYDPNN